MYTLAFSGIRVNYLIFKVIIVITANMIPIIQKRVTILDSCMPFF
jgi:hypothetical protein